MNFTLIDDVENYFKFWSVRFNILGSVFGILEALSVLGEYLPLLGDVMPKGPYAVITLLCLLASLAARIFKQPTLEKPAEVVDEPTP